MQPDPATMRHISVIIPYFQRQPGLLREAVQSVAGQYFPWRAKADLIVVDDGSPLPAEADLHDLPLPDWLQLRILHQDNAGPAAARNRGLDRTAPASHFVAFLDSDDRWGRHHLASGIAAMGADHDVYFCDSAMPPTTLFAASPFFATLDGAEPLDEAHRLYSLPQAKAGPLMIREYLCQTSTVILRASACRTLRFDESLRYAGEDWLMWARLAYQGRGVCFSLAANSLRGQGINLYRDAHDRLSARNLRRILSMIRTNELMGAIEGIDARSLALTRQRRRNFQMELAAILLHPRLYRGMADRFQRAMIARAYRHLWRDLPGFWAQIVRRKLTGQAQPA
jgi:succinoglycan biosynthesis protein ExoW